MVLKRVFDFTFALLGLLLSSVFLVFVYILVSIDTRSNGLFFQTRIGQFGKKFSIVKFKTVHPLSRKISPVGRFFRTTKLDELPQLWNILVGEMSFVGPRPDVPGYYDQLEGEARKILALKPGLTCEASLKYAYEEVLLTSAIHSSVLNDTVIFPDKVAMNLNYYHNRTFFGDILILYTTFLFSIKKTIHSLLP